MFSRLVGAGTLKKKKKAISRKKVPVKKPPIMWSQTKFTQLDPNERFAVPDRAATTNNPDGWSQFSTDPIIPDELIQTNISNEVAFKKFVTKLGTNFHILLGGPLIQNRTRILTALWHIKFRNVNGELSVALESPFGSYLHDVQKLKPRLGRKIGMGPSAKHKLVVKFPLDELLGYLGAFTKHRTQNRSGSDEFYDSITQEEEDTLYDDKLFFFNHLYFVKSKEQSTQASNTDQPKFVSSFDPYHDDCQYLLFNPRFQNSGTHACYWNCLRYILKIGKKAIDALKLLFKITSNTPTSIPDILKINKYINDNYDTYKVKIVAVDHQFIDFDTNKSIISKLETEHSITYLPTRMVKRCEVDNITFTTGVLFISDNHCSILTCYTPSNYCSKCHSCFTEKELANPQLHTCKTVTDFKKNPKMMNASADFETRTGENNRQITYMAQISHFWQGETITEVFYGLDCLFRFYDYVEHISKLAKMGITLIFFNGAKFDAIIYHEFLRSNYSSCVDEESVILGSGIKSFHYNSHHVIDARNHLGGSLEKLCSDFKLADSVSKMKDFTFETAGITHTMSSKELLLMQPQLSPEEFIEYLDQNPDYKEAIIAYGKNDTISLLTVWNLYGDAIINASGFSKFNVSDYITAPSMAFALFKLHRERERKNIIKKYLPKAETNSHGNIVIPGKLFDGTPEDFFNRLPTTKLYEAIGHKYYELNISQLDDFKLLTSAEINRLLSRVYTKKRVTIPTFSRDGELHPQFKKYLLQENVDPKIIFSELINTHFVNPRLDTSFITFADGKTSKIKVKSDVTKFIEESIIGGISYFKETGFFPGNYVGKDVTSLYPFVMAHSPFPYGDPIETSTYQKDKLGIYRCQNIKMNRKYISDVPGMRDGILDWTVTEIDEKILTSTDINRILEAGGSLDILEGYYFKYSYNPFKSFIETYFNLKQAQDNLPKSERNEALRNVCKLVLNSLFGKYCRRNDMSKIITSYSLDLIADTDEVEAIDITSGKFFKREKQEVLDCPIQIGTFILANSRDYMQSLFDEIGRENVAVSETDSIYGLDTHLNELDFLTEQTGIGHLTTEVSTSEGLYVCGKKAYCLLKPVIKGEQLNYKCVFKAVNSKSLKPEFYQELLENGTISTETHLWKRVIHDKYRQEGIYIEPALKQITLPKEERELQLFRSLDNYFEIDC